METWNTNGGILSEDMCTKLNVDFAGLKTVLIEKNQGDVLAEMTLTMKTTKVPSDFGGGPHRSADNRKYATIVSDEEVNRLVNLMLEDSRVKAIAFDKDEWKRYALTFMVRRLRKFQVKLELFMEKHCPIHI